MRESFCPRCRSATDEALGIIYCTQCAWGRAAAEYEAVQQSINWGFWAFWGLGMTLFWGLLQTKPAGIDWAEGAVNWWYWVGMAFVLSIPGRLAWRAKRARKKLRAKESTYRPEVTDPEQDPIAVPRKLEYILSAPRPRRIALAEPAWLTLAVFAVFLVVLPVWFVARLTLSEHPLSGQDLAFVIFVCVLSPAAVARQVHWILRNARLLRDGQVALARITGTGRFTIGKLSTFEFTDAEGETYRSTCVPIHGRSAEGQEGHLVFYDPSDPKQNILLPGSLFKVLRPGSQPALAIDRT